MANRDPQPPSKSRLTGFAERFRPDIVQVQSEDYRNPHELPAGQVLVLEAQHTVCVAGDPGLFFLGLPWQWTWGSARFSGVGADAEHVVETISR